MDEIKEQTKSIPNLTQETHDRWFRQMKIQLKGKDWFYTIESTLQEHAKVGGVGMEVDGTEVFPILEGSKVVNIRLNLDKKAKYLKDEASALSYMCRSLSDDDEALVDEYDTARTLWNYLKSKYSRTSDITANSYLTMIQTFTFKPTSHPEMTVIEAWDKLKEYRRKLGAANPAFKDSYRDEALLLVLTRSLPSEYQTTIDAMSVQSTLAVEDKIKYLTAKELSIQETEQAHTASRKYVIPNRRRDSRGSSPPIQQDRGETANTYTCHLCEQEGHFLRDCKDLALAQALIRKHYRAQRRKTTLKKTTKVSFSKRKSDQARLADGESLPIDLDSSESEEESDNEECRVSKELIRKTTPSHWYADTGASSHMSDQLSLFRDIKKIKRKTIKVGGGVMYCDRIGTAAMELENGGMVLLSKTLYVPGLGVNLLSGRKICEAGLKGRFNSDRMYFRKNGINIIKAKMDRGIYMISDIAKGYEDVALQSTETIGDIEPNEITLDTSSDKTKKDLETYLLWHRRFNHLGPEKIRNLHKVTTLGKPIKVPSKIPVCEVCALTKMKNLIPKQLSSHKTRRLELIHFDIAGPFPKSLRGNRYFLLIIDSWTRVNWILTLKTKDEAIPRLKKWKTELELGIGDKIVAARTDNAPELIQAVKEWNSGTRSELTTVASSHQNGAAERNIGTAEADMRAMLKEAGLPLEFWDEAVEYDAHCRNRTNTGPIIDDSIVSPIEAFTGSTPDISHCRIWGSKCYAYINPKTIPKDQRHDKLRDTARVGIFMGYSHTTNRHVRVYSPELGYTVRASRVTIDESKRGGDLDLRIRSSASGPQGTENVIPDRRPRGRPHKIQEAQESPSESLQDAATPESPKVVIPSVPKVDNIQKFNEDSEGNIVEINQPAEPILSPGTKEIEMLDATPEINKPSTETPITPMDVDPPERYSFRKRKRDDSEPDEHVQKLIRAMIAILSADPGGNAIEHAMISIPLTPRIDPNVKTKVSESLQVILGSSTDEDTAFPAEQILGIPIPTTYNQAVSDPEYGEKWKQAVQEEISSLVENGTWEEYILPKGGNLVSTKWVFTIKTKDNKIERFKARLVARGFSQVLGKDYNETFAPTVRLDTLRLFLAIIAKENLECWHFDIKNAFTESHLKEEIYLAPPQGVNVSDGRVLRALRSLYGLKQAGRDWSQLLKSELINWGFTQSLADPCLYTYAARQLNLLVYVDDIIASSTSKDQLNWFSTTLSSRFNAKNLGEISKILGIRVIRDRANRSLTLDQEEYLEAMLTKFGISHAQHHAKKIPAADYSCLRPATEDDELIDVTEYQQAIGSLIHPMVYTRPDISFVLGRLSQYMAKPAKCHGIGVKNLMRYLRATITQKLKYGPEGVQYQIAKEYSLPADTIKVFTDADWASDRYDRKSISGGVVMFYGGPISWASKKQNSVATSSAESEYISMAMFTKQGRWLAQMLKDLGKEEYVSARGDTVQLLGDNQGAIALTKNPHLHERSKHIDICYHFIRDLTEKEKVVTSYINTSDMVADGMTKPLARVAFERFKDMLGLRQ